MQSSECSLEKSHAVLFVCGHCSPPLHLSNSNNALSASCISLSSCIAQSDACSIKRRILRVIPHFKKFCLRLKESPMLMYVSFTLHNLSCYISHWAYLYSSIASNAKYTQYSLIQNVLVTVFYSSLEHRCQPHKMRKWDNLLKKAGFYVKKIGTTLNYNNSF